MKEKVQLFGRFLSGMVMPNIGAFIAWGLIAALFISTGWIPNEKFAAMVDPMSHMLLPLLIAYTGGEVVAGKRGGIIGAIATMGTIVGSPDMPMFIGAMITGPLAGWVIKQFDKKIEDFSGGQKKKVLLSKSLCQKSHLYIWDEPLNFIDVLSRIQIEKLLLQYQPTMLFVEHDAAFTQKIATKFVELKS